MKAFYHGNCHDGFCAAWLFRRAHPEAELIPAFYGQPIKTAPDDDVFFLDFCPPRHELHGLQARSITVIDHHKTTPDRVLDWHPAVPIHVYYDSNYSGARMTQGYLKAPGSWLIDYTEDRDLWRWKLPHSKAVNAWLRSYPLDFDVWDRLLADHPDETYLTDRVEEGEAILRMEARVVEEHVKQAREIAFDGHRCLYVNATTLFSEIAGELAERAPIGACYRDRADGLRSWSLRSTSVDVSEVAKHRGGGGHRNAAGFEWRPGPSAEAMELREAVLQASAADWKDARGRLVELAEKVR